MLPINICIQMFTKLPSLWVRKTWEDNFKIYIMSDIFPAFSPVNHFSYLDMGSCRHRLIVSYPSNSCLFTTWNRQESKIWTSRSGSPPQFEAAYHMWLVMCLIQGRSFFLFYKTNNIYIWNKSVFISILMAWHDLNFDSTWHELASKYAMTASI